MNLTCKQALRARYSINGKRNGINQYSPDLSFDEAQRFYNYLTREGFSVRVVARVDGCVVQCKGSQGNTP